MTLVLSGPSADGGWNRPVQRSVSYSDVLNCEFYTRTVHALRRCRAGNAKRFSNE